MAGNKFKPGFWIGVGAKGGGTAAVAGLEDTEGVIFDLNNINNCYGFGISGFRLGVGLGLGAGLVVVLVFDCPVIGVLNGSPSSDWGFNFALGEKWSSMLKGLTQYKFFANVAKIGTVGNRITPEEFEDLRSAASYLYTAADGIPDGKPKMIVLDIPGAGIGTEVSLHWCWSEFRLYGGTVQGALQAVRTAIEKAKAAGA